LISPFLKAITSDGMPCDRYLKGHASILAYAMFAFDRQTYQEFARNLYPPIDCDYDGK
jgi:hypothetical protein